MNKLILLAAILLTGCATTFEQSALKSSQMDTHYCNGNGFKAYSELNDYVTFVCSDNRRFTVAK